MVLVDKYRHNPSPIRCMDEWLVIVYTEIEPEPNNRCGGSGGAHGVMSLPGLVQLGWVVIGFVDGLLDRTEAVVRSVHCSSVDPRSLGPVVLRISFRKTHLKHLDTGAIEVV